MLAIAADEALCADLRSLGRARAAEFTWDRTARLTVDVYRKAIDSSA
jgi:glycosyltransferase involved in cell wall biosynthesis